MRAAIYVRVSTEEQKKGLSIDTQLQALQEYAIKNDLDVVGVYNDAGYSGKLNYKKRPALGRLVNDCQAHKIDVILVTRLDRWFRSVPYYYETQRILDDNGVYWRTIWEDYETQTANGKFKVNIIMSANQQEAERTGERIKSVMEYKRRNGEYLGRTPLGYIRDGKWIKADPALFEGVSVFFETFARTGNVVKSRKAALECGVKITYNVARNMLLCPTYSGEVNGFPCDAYITKEQLRINKEYLKRRSGRRDAKRTYLFSGLVVCGECGYTLTSHVCRVKRWQYLSYECRSNIAHFSGCSQCTVYEATLEKYMLGKLAEDISRYQVEFERDKTKEQKTPDKKIHALQEKKKRIGVRFEDGDISLEEYRDKRKQIDDEIKRLEAEKEEQPINVVALPDNWRDMYDSLSRESQKAFWRGIIKRIVYFKHTKEFRVEYL